MMKLRMRKRLALRRLQAAKRLPFFPLIPLVPAALFFGSLLTSIRALVRVRRVERRLAVGAA